MKEKLLIIGEAKRLVSLRNKARKNDVRKNIRERRGEKKWQKQ